MGNRRRKNRTHVPPPPPNVNGPNSIPKSFVVRTGKASTGLSQLVKDFRGVMEPHTGSRVRERKNNTLRDYISIAPLVGVTHLIVFSQPESLKIENASDGEHQKVGGLPNLRISRLPKGPSLSFKILRYSLRSDIMRASKRPHGKGREMDTEPILILSSFPPPTEKPTPEQNALSLLSTTFQSLFPPLKVHSTPLSNFRRVVLLSYNSKTRTVQFRHYLISLRPVDVSKRVRKLGSSRSRGGSVIDLGDREDIADYILRRARAPSESGESLGGKTDYTMESETEVESETEAESSGGSGSENEGKKPVRLPEDYVGGSRRGSKRAVGLVELGPRMELALWKVDTGVVGAGKGKEGETLWHEVVKKTEKEKKELERKAQEREKRREEIRVRTEAKRAEKKKSKEIKGKGEDEDEDEDEDEGIEMSEEDDFNIDDVVEDEDDEDEQMDDDDSDLTPIPIDDYQDGFEDEEDGEEGEEEPKKKKSKKNK